METETGRNRQTKRRVNKAAALLAVFAVCCLYSCSSDVLYSEFKPLGDGWSKSEPLRFDFPDSLTEDRTDFGIDVRHDNYYPYRNLWVVVDYLKIGKVAETDTVNIMLADKFGNWYGSGLGRLYQLRSTVRRGMNADEFDGVVVWHYMRCDTVTGISDVGVSISLCNKPDADYD